MHGCPRSHTRSWLAKTLQGKTTNKIEIEDVTDWKVGEEIAVTCSSFDFKQTEFFSITAINGKDLTLNATLKYRHFGKSETTFAGKLSQKALTGNV